MSGPAFFAAIAKYEGLRAAAYSHTMTWLTANDPLASHIRLTEIDQPALGFWSAHWTAAPSPFLAPPFDWTRLDADFSPYVHRFEVAIWYDDTLCGMAIGRPSAGLDNVTIHVIERFYGNNPLAGRISMICFEVADAYAKILGKRYLKIKNPDIGAIRHYKRLLFTSSPQIGQNTYMSRPVV